MPAEEYTYTGNDVAIRVRSQFGDTSGAQLGDPALLSWINDGQREIVNSNPVLRGTKITDLVGGQYDYSFPDDKVLTIEAIYVEGYPIVNMSPQAAREFIQSQDPLKVQKATRPDVWYERNGIITFYPVPTYTVTNGIKLEYIKNPVALVALNDTIAIPDRYLNELVNYVIAQSLEMDENFDGASYKLRQFRDGLDRQSNRENTSQNSTYDGVLADPTDFWF